MSEKDLAAKYAPESGARPVFANARRKERHFTAFAERFIEEQDGVFQTLGGV